MCLSSDMKIFISWSGAYSHGVAQALKGWLRYIFTDVQSFVSSEDIRKGKRWLLEISKELNTTNFGIVCLTTDNLDAPWLLFEAGALSKLKSAQVCTLLLGNLRSGDIDGPLSHFQNTHFNKTDFFKLLQVINQKNGKNRLDEAQFKTMFEKWWPDLDKNIMELSRNHTPSIQDKRTERDLLYELLDITRSIARNEMVDEESHKKLRTLLRVKVNELPLSPEAIVKIKALHIGNVGTLAMMDKTFMPEVCGAEVYDELTNAMEQLGLNFNMSFDESVFAGGVSDSRFKKRG